MNLVAASHPRLPTPRPTTSQLQCPITRGASPVRPLLETRVFFDLRPFRKPAVCPLSLTPPAPQRSKTATRHGAGGKQQTLLLLLLWWRGSIRSPQRRKKTAHCTRLWVFVVALLQRVPATSILTHRLAGQRIFTKHRLYRGVGSGHKQAFFGRRRCSIAQRQPPPKR